MKSILSALFLSFSVAACSASAPADTQALGSLHVSDPWSKATPPNARVAGGFVTIYNRGDTDDRLLRVESTASRRVEIHEMNDVDGVARMRELAGGLPLPADQATTLQPGGLHLMFIEPKQPFVEGQSVQATLVFEKAGRLATEFKVRPINATNVGRKGQGHH